MTESLVEVRNVSRKYHLGESVVDAVKETSMSVEQGSLVTITGRSGSGKSTFLSMIGGLTKPTTGEIMIDGTNIWKIGDKKLSKIRSEKIGFMFQFASFIPTLTVIENVMLPSTFKKGKNRKDVSKRAQELLEMVGLGDKINAFTSQLSGGQMRRVSIARSLMNDPELILADEPTGDLDEFTEMEIMRLLDQVKERGIAMMIVTHNPRLVSAKSRHFRMRDGVLTEKPYTSYVDTRAGPQME